MDCTEEEGSGHTHTESCYETNKTLTCEKEELDVKLHTHDKTECYDEDGNLTYELPKLEEHEHSKECFTDENGEEEYLSGNSISEDNVSGNSLSGNSVSGDSISRDNVFGNSISGNSVSGNSLSENAVSENSASEKVITLETKVDDMVITLSGLESSFVEGKKLSIQAEKVEGDGQTEAVEESVNQMAEVDIESEEKEEEANDYQAFDIRLLADGEEVQPLGPVEVKFSGQLN